MLALKCPLSAAASATKGAAQVAVLKVASQQDNVYNHPQVPNSDMGFRVFRVVGVEFWMSGFQESVFSAIGRGLGFLGPWV